MVSLVSAGLPVGTTLAFDGALANIPVGFLHCDGSTINRNDFSALFAAIGIAHGYGDQATTFEIPDHRGAFLRGVDHARGLDTNSGTRTAAQSGGNIGNLVGSYQLDENKSHKHISGPMGTGNTNQYYAYGFVAFGGSNVCYNQFSNTSGNYSAWTETVGNEGRPKNNYTNYIIKY